MVHPSTHTLHDGPTRLHKWLSVLPRNISIAALSKHWRKYLDDVYSRETLPGMLDVSALQFFYPDAVPAGIRNEIPLLGFDATHNLTDGEALLKVGAHRVQGRRELDLYRLYHSPFTQAATQMVWRYAWPTHQERSRARQPRQSDDSAFINPASSHERVEVMHCREGFEQTGYWMYRARGSGEPLQRLPCKAQ